MDNLYRQSTWFLFPTWRCNLNCRMCFSMPERYHPGELTGAVWSRIIRFGLQFTHHFDIGGGEPFMKKELKDILETIANHHGYSTITSNGTLIPNGFDHSCPPTRLEISLDSPVPGIHDRLRGAPGSFSRAVTGIRHAIRLKKQKGLHTGIGIAHIMLKSNIKDFPALIKFLNSFNIDYVYSQQLDFLGRGKGISDELPSIPDYLAMLFPLIKTLRTLEPLHIKQVSIYFPHPYYPFLKDVLPESVNLTTAGGKNIRLHLDIKNCNCKYYDTMMAIQPDGVISGCFGSLHLQEMSLGNIREFLDDPEALREAAAQKRDKDLAVINEPGFKCKSCPHFQICRGGCRANALAYFGNLYEKDPRCPGPGYKVPHNTIEQIKDLFFS